MSTSFEGGCICGEVRYCVEAEPVVVAHCHCRDCQQTSGGRMSTIVIVPRVAFKLVKGTPRQFYFVADSGNRLAREFCINCSAPLFTDLKAMSDLWVVKAASLDDPRWLKPAMHIWTASRQPWDSIDDGLPQYPGNPPM